MLVFLRGCPGLLVFILFISYYCQSSILRLASDPYGWTALLTSVTGPWTSLPHPLPSLAAAKTRWHHVLFLFWWFLSRQTQPLCTQQEIHELSLTPLSVALTTNYSPSPVQLIISQVLSSSSLHSHFLCLFSPMPSLAWIIVLTYEQFSYYFHSWVPVPALLALWRKFDCAFPPFQPSWWFPLPLERA